MLRNLNLFETDPFLGKHFWTAVCKTVTTDQDRSLPIRPTKRSSIQIRRTLGLKILPPLLHVENTNNYSYAVFIASLFDIHRVVTTSRR